MGALIRAIEANLQAQALREQAEHAEREQARGWKAVYPSLLGRCLRQTTFVMAGAPAPSTDTASLRRMAEGDRIHEKYQRWFEEMGILIGAEMRLEYPEAWISGRIDAIVRHPEEPDHLLVVEIKSASDASFAEQLRAGPYKHYQDQLHLYLYLLQTHPECLQDGTLPEHQRMSGVVLLENKNSQRMHEYPVELDLERGKALIERAKLLHDRVEAVVRLVEAGAQFTDPVVRELLPAPEHDGTSVECAWCPYFELCWLEVIEALAMEEAEA